MTGATPSASKETPTERKKRKEEEDRIRKEVERRRKEEDRIRKEADEERTRREAEAERIKKASGKNFTEDENGHIARAADGTSPAFPGDTEMADKEKLGRGGNIGLKGRV